MPGGKGGQLGGRGRIVRLLKGGSARHGGLACPKVSSPPAFDAAVRSQSTAMIPAHAECLEWAGRRPTIRRARTPAPYGAFVPQRARKALAAVYDLAAAVRHAVRVPSPRSVGFVYPLIRPASAGAVGLRLAGLDFPIRAPDDTSPAPYFPIGPEPAGMVATGAHSTDSIDT